MFRWGIAHYFSPARSKTSHMIARGFLRTLAALLIQRLRQNLHTPAIRKQVELRILHVQLPAEVRIYRNPALPVGLRIRPQIVRVEQHCFNGFGVLPVRVKKLLVLTPSRDRINLSYASIQASDEQSLLG